MASVQMLRNISRVSRPITTATRVHPLYINHNIATVPSPYHLFSTTTSRYDPSADGKKSVKDKVKEAGDQANHTAGNMLLRGFEGAEKVRDKTKEAVGAGSKKTQEGAAKASEKKEDVKERAQAAKDDITGNR